MRRIATLISIVLVTGALGAGLARAGAEPLRTSGETWVSARDCTSRNYPLGCLLSP